MADEDSIDDPYADWPDRTTATDDGRTVLFYSAAESIADGLSWADGVWVPPNVSSADAAAFALQAMTGWVLSTSDGRFAAVLQSAGAQERRHAHSMSHDLKSMPTVQPAPDLRIEPLTPAQIDRHALRLGALNHRAYPPGHPDAFDGDEAAAVSQVRAIARGEILGPMTSESRVALASGNIVGACLVVDRPGNPPHGGPWIVDLFRDVRSQVRGVGSALVADVLVAARDAELPGMSLVVSHANQRARRLYSWLGFVDVEESWTLVLPKKNERPNPLDRVAVS